jgi:hypothetical protein
MALMLFAFIRILYLRSVINADSWNGHDVIFVGHVNDKMKSCSRWITFLDMMVLRANGGSITIPLSRQQARTFSRQRYWNFDALWRKSGLTSHNIIKVNAKMLHSINQHKGQSYMLSTLCCVCFNAVYDVIFLRCSSDFYFQSQYSVYK